MKKLLLGIVCIAFFGTTAMAQTVTFAGNGSTTQLAGMGSDAYHVSEYIYSSANVGATNFLTPASAIQKINLNITALGYTSSFSNVKIYLKEVAAATTSFTAGNYSTAGYTLVYDGVFPGSPTGWVGVTLSTPFMRTLGTNNLQMMLERTDGVSTSNGAANPPVTWAADNTVAASARRYNGTAPLSGATALSTSAFRVGVQFVAPIPIDATLTSISAPAISCNTTSNISVVLRNQGTTPIAIGAASVTLRLGGANSSQAILNNSTLIAPNTTETITFNNVSVANSGTTRDSAFVTLVGDGDVVNDTIKGSFITASNINVNSTTPVVEDVEGSLPVFGYISVLAGNRQLWSLYDVVDAAAPYSNSSMPTGTSLSAHGGNTFFYFDNYSGASSVGFSGRLFSNCITLPPTTASCASSLTFWMSHDAIFPTDLDSMYVSISTDKGATWTRIPGAAYGRYDAAYSTIGWAMKTVDLSAYQGQTFQVGFEGVSKYGNIIGLDDITISTNCVQPVELSSFTGVKVNGVNKLNWNTATELNNSGFELQRSADGKNFTKLAFVNSKSENGNSASPLSYTFVDENPLRGANYYRLNQVDKDGKSTLSEIVTIKGDKVSKLEVSAIFPNPVKDRLTVKIEGSASEKVSVQVVDLAGKVLSVQNVQVGIGENQISVNTSKLTNGNYILKVTTENGETSVQKFVKQ